MTKNKTELLPWPDASKAENWHYHDEYEFWYIAAPERKDFKRPFFPWELFQNTRATVTPSEKDEYHDCHSCQGKGEFSNGDACLYCDATGKSLCKKMLSDKAALKILDSIDLDIKIKNRDRTIITAKECEILRSVLQQPDDGELVKALEAAIKDNLSYSEIGQAIVQIVAKHKAKVQG